ncbi:MAG: hypothetical protein P8X90_36065 [Desulfobacterales bacterium]
MEHRSITGIGCFAGLEKLNRVFLRMAKTYALGKLDGLEWSDCSESGEAEATKLLKTLISGKAAWQDTSIPKAGDSIIENKKITGFFLTLKDQRLKLLIFAKNGDCGLERHLAVLDALTTMRRRRLN